MRLTPMALVILLCAPADAGPFSPPAFTPMTHPDGSQTWSLKILLTDIPAADRDSPDRDTKVASTFLAHHKFCERGWRITQSSADKKWLMLEGRCT